jgi:hypothetical protein
VLRVFRDDRPRSGRQVGDGPGVFLASLNAWRAQNGRGPLGWSNTLASYAAMNNAVHAPGSMAPGASQCSAPVSSYTHAFAMWTASPIHAAILLNATTEVGCAPCVSGLTANAR